MGKLEAKLEMADWRKFPLWATFFGMMGLGVTLVASVVVGQPLWWAFWFFMGLILGAIFIVAKERPVSWEQLANAFLYGFWGMMYVIGWIGLLVLAGLLSTALAVYFAKLHPEHAAEYIRLSVVGAWGALALLVAYTLEKSLLKKEKRMEVVEDE